MLHSPWPALNKGSDEHVSPHRGLFQDLYRFVSRAAPGSAVRGSLATRLRLLPRGERRQLVSQLVEGCSPLFIAAREGQVTIVEFLLAECDADIEQRGDYEVVSDRTRHRVTPLWCAAVAGRLTVVRCLCQHGANVNCLSDSGSTPVRSACFMTHLEIVRFLVCDAGADIRMANHSGGTCLINSVQSHPLCQFLIEHGADVNAVDVQNKSALHYAIQEHREETTRLLMQHGADPLIVSRSGDDALQTACLKGDASIFDLLQDKVSYSEARLADAHELIGATFVDEHHDVTTAWRYWQYALEIRFRNPTAPIFKRQLPSNPVYLNEREFETFDELDDMRADWDQIKVQSLLITERILGTEHKDMTFRLMYRGAAYADSLLYQRCVDLWLYALQLRVQRDHVIFHEVCFSAQALVRLLLDVLDRQRLAVAGPQLQLLQRQDVVTALQLLVDQLPEAVQLLACRPQFERQQRDFDLTLVIVVRLVYLLVQLEASEAYQSEGDASKFSWKRLVYRAVKLAPRTLQGYTLLHLAATPNSLPTTQLDDAQTSMFPCPLVARLLVDCGADVNAEDNSGVTPLLLVAVNYVYRPIACAPVVDELLAAGAHVDQRRDDEDSPLQLLERAGHRFRRLEHVSLRCLAARVVRQHVPRHVVPDAFRAWVDQH